MTLHRRNGTVSDWFVHSKNLSQFLAIYLHNLVKSVCMTFLHSIISSEQDQARYAFKNHKSSPSQAKGIVHLIPSIPSSLKSIHEEEDPSTVAITNANHGMNREAILSFPFPNSMLNSFAQKPINQTSSM